MYLPNKRVQTPIRKITKIIVSKEKNISVACAKSFFLILKKKSSLHRKFLEIVKNNIRVLFERENIRK